MSGVLFVLCRELDYNATAFRGCLKVVYLARGAGGRGGEVLPWLPRFEELVGNIISVVCSENNVPLIRCLVLLDLFFSGGGEGFP